MTKLHACLVGGFVRDRLIGCPARERDWVVCGASEAQLLRLGYTRVGAFFPVFLHPRTGEEHALARSERKTSTGHTGFATHIDSVSLTQDLQRRDLTINAMALTKDGKIIDPCGGMRDIQGRWLRHVSPAFSEDPLRVLRVARFAAQLAPWGFRVAPATLELMAHMAKSGELASLSQERVWQETSRALMCERPSVYFLLLRTCGALVRLFGEIDALFGVPQTASYHPEIDCGIHTMMVVDMAASAQLPLAERMAALLHDLGKAHTPAQILPSHKGHEARGAPLVDALCHRLKTGREIHRLARLCCVEHLLCHRAMELKPSTICDLFDRLDVWRRPQFLAGFVRVCKADAKGRLGFETSDYPQADYLLACYSAARRINIAATIEGIASDSAKPAAIRAARIAAIAACSA